jgi:hypothetical protein
LLDHFDLLVVVVERNFCIVGLSCMLGWLHFQLHNFGKILLEYRLDVQIDKHQLGFLLHSHHLLHS